MVINEYVTTLQPLPADLLYILQKLHLGGISKYFQTIYNDLNRDEVFGTFHNFYKGDPNARPRKIKYLSEITPLDITCTNNLR